MQPEVGNHRRPLTGLHTCLSDCSEYRKLPARPDDEARALLKAWRAQVRDAERPARVMRADAPALRQAGR